MKIRLANKLFDDPDACIDIRNHREKHDPLTNSYGYVKFTPAMFRKRVASFCTTPLGKVEHLTILDSRQSIVCGESVSLRRMSWLWVLSDSVFWLFRPQSFLWGFFRLEQREVRLHLA